MWFIRGGFAQRIGVLLILLLLLFPVAPSRWLGACALAPTTITVTSTADDYTDGKSKTCAAYPAEPCTLRRAINQAYGLGADSRPVTIAFDIPSSDSGYNSALGAWKITLTGTTLHDLRELNGQTILDGTTQPGGRGGGPNIIIDGDGSKNHGLILRSGGNEVRGVAMQNFNTDHISISSDNNTIQDCWFGLADDGMTLSSGDDTVPEESSGVAFAAGSDGNSVRDNAFAGFNGVAAAIRGDNNTFAGNTIGLRSDGTVPIPAQFDLHPCYGNAWAGGSGITVSDNDNQIGGAAVSDRNVFAGLYLDISATSTQRPAMDVVGSGHMIRNNVIGYDALGKEVGVCGRGLDFGGEPQDMLVQDNVIYQPGLSAIFMNAPQLNGNTLRGNLILRENAWPGPQGFNDFSEDAIAYGRTVPTALLGFEPAVVTDVDGTTVSGTAASGSPCPSCVVELFLDDSDGITETLASVAVVTANSSGHWTATLGAPLDKAEGLRTMSTVPDSFTIPGLNSGTTSKLSVLQAVGPQMVYLPMVVR